MGAVEVAGCVSVPTKRENSTKFHLQGSCSLWQAGERTAQLGHFFRIINFTEIQCLRTPQPTKLPALASGRVVALRFVHFRKLQQQKLLPNFASARSMTSLWRVCCVPTDRPLNFSCSRPLSPRLSYSRRSLINIIFFHFVFLAHHKKVQKVAPKKVKNQQLSSSFNCHRQTQSKKLFWQNYNKNSQKG